MNIVNRCLLTILGLGTVVAGVAGLSVSRGWMSVERLNEISRHRDLWDWWVGLNWTDPRLLLLALVGAAVAMVAAFAAIREILPHRDPEARSVVIDETSRGVTSIRTKAVRRALSHDAASVSGVQSARVDLEIGTSPTAMIDIRTDAGEDVAAAARQVRQRMLDGISRCLGRDTGRVDVRIDAGHNLTRSPQKKVV